MRTEPWPSWPAPVDADVHALRGVLDSGSWHGVGARAVVDFEAQFSELISASHAVTCVNGTVSLEIALRALGVGAGDEVIVPPYTFLATASAVLGVNALPVFADIEPATYCIDPDEVEAAITSRTVAVIAVHLGGHPADLDRAPWLDALAGARLPLLIDVEQTSWPEIDRVAARWPELRLVVCRVGYRAMRPLAGVLERAENVHVDLSYLSTHAGLERLVQRFGPHRVVFGTGMPERDPADAVTRLMLSELDDAAASTIAHHSWAQLCRERVRDDR